MESINTITERVMQKIKINELTLCGYMRKYQLTRKQILNHLELFVPYGRNISLHSEVLKIRLAGESAVLDFKYYRAK